MNIFILPSNNKNNAYIEMLIKSIEEKKLEDLFIYRTKKDTVLEVFNQIVFGKVKQDKNILHIQWPTVIYGSQYLVKSVFALFFNVLLIYILKLFFRTKIVWTIHNNFSHDYLHKKFDLFGMETIFRLSDAIIVQQKKTFTKLDNKHLNKQIYYIPHPNYIGVYGPLKNKDVDFRKSLGFGDDDTVLLSLGAIKKYKKNEEIISAVSEVRKSFPELKLVVIGKGDQSYIDYLNSLAKGDRGIIIKNYFVPDSEISRYLSIADYSIFYYDNSEMTSGGIILSLSYGIPVISRNIAGAEMIAERSGFVFRNHNELVDILSNLKSKNNNFQSSDIIDSVKKDDWRSVSDNLINIYKKL